MYFPRKSYLNLMNTKFEIGVYFQDGQSYRTRVLSFRSTNDRSVYSARKSINVTPDNTLRVDGRNSCHCSTAQNKENGFDYTKNNEFSMHSRNNTKRFMNVNLPLDTKARGKRKSRYSEDEIPIGDERVSELYIFPNSNIVEFTDISYDEKV